MTNSKELKMDKTKYGKYFITEPCVDGHTVKCVRFYCGRHFGDIPFSIIWQCITEPFVMQDKPHKHDFDQFLHFYGGNPKDVTDFGAVAELSLGEEGEKHTINKTTIVHIPKGLIHCPLVFKKIDRPIMFMNTALTPDYPSTRPDQVEIFDYKY
jgi:hypothetical protein